MEQSKIMIHEFNDGFSIVIDEKIFYFNQEDDKTKLIDVFEELGYVDVKYELVY